MLSLNKKGLIFTGVSLLTIALMTGCGAANSAGNNAATNNTSNNTVATSNTAANNTSSNPVVNPKTDQDKAAQVAIEYMVLGNSANYKDPSSFTALTAVAAPSLAKTIKQQKTSVEKTWTAKKYYETPGTATATFLGMKGKDWVFKVSLPVKGYQDPGGKEIDHATVVMDLQVEKTSSGFLVLNAASASNSSK